MNRSASKKPLEVAAWGLVLYAGVRLIDIVLESKSLAALVGQAVLVEWGAARLDVVWTEPGTPAASTLAVARRVAAGAGLGLALAATVLAIELASRAARVERVPGLELSVLGIGLVTAGLQAWRDELLHHGIILRALDATSVPAAGRVLACGATSAGAALGRSDATPQSVFVALLLGVVFGAVWLHDRGAWRPCAAHAALRWATGTLLSGGVAYARLADNSWAGGGAGLLGGTAAVIALAPFAVLAVAWAARRRVSPPPARVG